MVMDFGDLKEIVNKIITKPFDHATVLNVNSPHKELADNIKVEYLTEYSCWLKIMTALKNLNMDNVADEISQKAPDKYDKTNNDKIYNSIKSKTINFIKLSFL